jgi:hypothetical protein
MYSFQPALWEFIQQLRFSQMKEPFDLMCNNTAIHFLICKYCVNLIHKPAKNIVIGWRLKKIFKFLLRFVKISRMAKKISLNFSKKVQKHSHYHGRRVNFDVRDVYFTLSPNPFLTPFTLEWLLPAVLCLRKS